MLDLSDLAALAVDHGREPLIDGVVLRVMPGGGLRMEFQPRAVREDYGPHGVNNTSRRAL